MKFRANDLRALLSNWQQFETILNDITTKASPELTASLLKTGMETYDTSVKRLSASMQVLGITIGNELLPSLKNMTDGLSEGVQWLSKHREEVSSAIKYIGLFAEALVLYRVQQLLANSTLGTFIGTTRMLVSNAPGVIGSIRAMGSAMTGFGMTIGFAVVKMAGFLAMAEAINRYATGHSQDVAEKQFQQSIAGVGSNDAGAGRKELTKNEQEALDAIATRDKYAEENRQNGIIDHLASAAGGVFFNSKDQQNEFDRLNEIARQKVAAAQTNDHLSDIQKMVAEAEKGMPTGAPKIDYQNVEGQDIGTPKATGLGRAEPNDHAEQMQRIRDQAEYRALINSIDLAEKAHTNTLGKLSTQEAVYGNTVGLTMKKQQENRDYIVTLGTEYDSLGTLKQKYIDQLDNELSTNADLNNVVSLAIPNWTSLTKAQQREQAKLNNELFQSFKTADQLNKLIGEIEGKQSTLHNTADGLRNEETKENKGGTGDVLKQSNRRIQGIKDQESIDIANTTNKLDPNNYLKLNKIKLESLKAQQVEHDAQIIFLQQEVDAAKKDGMEALVQAKEDALKKELVASAQNAEQIKQLEYEKNAKINEGLASITQEVLIQGNSLRGIWNNLWTGLANDAIKALFRIQNSSGGLLASVIGLFGGKSGGSTVVSGYGATIKASTANSLLPTKFADGGIVDNPTNALIGETGDTEAVINLGKLQKGDSRQRGLLSYANSKLGTQVEASVSPRTMEIAKQASIESKVNREHINELQRANSLMQEQNRMILHMINNGSQGNTTVAQPIIAKQDMSIEDFVSIAGKAKAMGYNV